jgi:nucleoside-diphosphate-sugar epimerase
VISSGDVYLAYGRLLGTEPGPPIPTPLDEGAQLRTVLFPYRYLASGPTDWLYHYEKILAERAALDGRLPATVLRLPAVYGPGDAHRRFRPYIVRMIDRRPVVLLEEAAARWRWTHGYVEDVAQAIARAVTDERATGKVYNVGEGNTPTLLDRVRRIGNIMGWNGRILSIAPARIPEHLRTPFDARQDLSINTRRIRSELNLDRERSEDESLGRTIEWEQRNPLPTGDPGPAEYAAEDAATG